jgi:hypothetical protein
MSNSYTQVWTASGLSAGTYPLKNTGAGGVFTGPNSGVMGGIYALIIAATGSGIVQLNDLAADNTTYVPAIDAIAANGLNRSTPVHRILPWHLAKTYSRYGLRALTSENLLPSPRAGLSRHQRSYDRQHNNASDLSSENRPGDIADPVRPCQRSVGPQAGAAAAPDGLTR